MLPVHDRRHVQLLCGHRSRHSHGIGEFRHKLRVQILAELGMDAIRADEIEGGGEVELVKAVALVADALAHAEQVNMCSALEDSMMDPPMFSRAERVS